MSSENKQERLSTGNAFALTLGSQKNLTKEALKKDLSGDVRVMELR